MSIDKYTIRVKPFLGESLFSYILRFSEQNGISFLDLWKISKKRRSHFIQINDIRVLNYAPVNIIDPIMMANVCALEVDEIYKMSFYYLLKRFCGESKVERSRFMSGLLEEEYYYCPLCLDEKPYHRLLWEVKEIKVCHIHKIKLTNECSSCHKIILIKELNKLNICPYCNSKLYKKTGSFNYVDNPTVLQQMWYYNALKKLTSSFDFKMKPEEIALKILYILNNCNSTFNKNNVRVALTNKENTLPMLLQHVRKTIHDKRTLHVKYLLSILYENHVSVSEFLKLKIPRTFIDLVRQKVILKKDKAYCLAPWCSNYKKKGSLIKTGTSFKRKINGNNLKYYLVCPNCGCGYGFDKEDILVERTYFIIAFNVLKEYSNKEISLRELSCRSGLSVDKLKRGLAYFASRKIYFETYNSKDFKCIKIILQKVVNAIKLNESIKSIEKWNIWNSYYEFLFYRFHKDVIYQINFKEHPKMVGHTYDLNEKKQLILSKLELMLNYKIDITIKSICKQMNICPETLRNWKLNSMVAEMKNKQKNIKLIESKKDISDNVNGYLSRNKNVMISSNKLYKELGIIRNVLWRKSPELTKLLREEVIQHNTRVRKEQSY